MAVSDVTSINLSFPMLSYKANTVCNWLLSYLTVFLILDLYYLHNVIKTDYDEIKHGKTLLREVDINIQLTRFSLIDYSYPTKAYITRFDVHIIGMV